jgi:hypothetical protein
MTTAFVASKFEVGEIVFTRGAMSCLTQDDVLKALVRHMNGDWGDVDDHDRKENEFALEQGLRLLSRYVTSTGATFWVITEHDRSITTFLLPEDY